MELTQEQIEARFAEYDKRMARMEREVNDIKTALEGNKALGIRGMVDTLSDVATMARETNDQFNRAKWLIAGAIIAGQGLWVVVSKALGL